MQGDWATRLMWCFTKRSCTWHNECAGVVSRWNASYHLPTAVSPHSHPSAWEEFLMWSTSSLLYDMKEHTHDGPHFMAEKTVSGLWIAFYECHRYHTLIWVFYIHVILPKGSVKHLNSFWRWTSKFEAKSDADWLPQSLWRGLQRKSGLFKHTRYSLL